MCLKFSASVTKVVIGNMREKGEEEKHFPYHPTYIRIVVISASVLSKQSSEVMRSVSLYTWSTLNLWHET
jgi:hypothetical protein